MKLKVVSKGPCGQLWICPTIYSTEDGTYVVQGKKVDEKIKKELGVPPEETLVEIPAEVMENFMESLNKT